MVVDKVNLLIQAKQSGETLAQASGFSAGKSTAVGAAVCVNIPSSEVTASFAGTAVVSGKAKIVAQTYDEDDSKAIATAVGADIDRYLNKFTKSQEAFETKANNLLSGSYFNGGASSGGNTNNTNNSTASGINGNLNGNSSSSGSGAGNNLSLSSNALRSQNVSATGTDATSSTTSTGTGSASNLTGNALGTGTSSQSQSYQVAAAVGLNITNHKALVNISGSLEARAIAILADNDGNFRTLGTGAAMSLESNSNAIAAGVAVSVNNNEATVTISGSAVLHASDEISASAELTQNMDGEYKGYLGAQALAGAVSGSGGSFSIGGAIAVIVSNAKTGVVIANGTAAHHADLSGSRITLSASDKSKLALRAGGISISKGASVGIGAAFALIYSNNAIAAAVGDYTVIRAESLVIRAEKLRVDMSDYESAFGVDTLITDSSALTEEQRAEAETGIIDVHKGEDDSSYSVELNISTDTVLDMIDLLNFLSSTNYYAEAIAGSIITGAASNSKASVAGAFAMVFFQNTVDALIGNHADIVLGGREYDVYTKDGEEYYVSGDDVYTMDAHGGLAASGAVKADLTSTGSQYIEGLLLLAANDANVRIIGGALVRRQELRRRRPQPRLPAQSGHRDRRGRQQQRHRCHKRRLYTENFHRGGRDGHHNRGRCQHQPQQHGDHRRRVERHRDQEPLACQSRRSDADSSGRRRGDHRRQQHVSAVYFGKRFGLRQRHRHRRDNRRGRASERGRRGDFVRHKRSAHDHPK